MPKTQEHILIAEKNPQIYNFLAEQTLRPLGYQVAIEIDFNSALRQLLTNQFDLVLANIDLPGLSGTDILVALRAQGLRIPVIMIAHPGQESKIIQAYRLGAADSLFWPFREAEVISVIERVQGQHKSLQSSAATLSEMEHVNQALQQRIRDLTTLHQIGLAAAKIHDPKTTFSTILSKAVEITGADFAWMLKIDQANQKQYLVGHQNLPNQLRVQLNKAWDIDFGSKVATTGIPLNIYEGDIRKTQLYPMANAVVTLPLKEKGAVIGVLTVAKKDHKPFSASDQKLLEIVAGYTSIAFTNIQLYQNIREQDLALQKQLDSTEIDRQLEAELLKQTASVISTISETAMIQIDQLLNQLDTQNTPQFEEIRSLLVSMEQAKCILNLLPQDQSSETDPNYFDLVGLVQQRISLFTNIAKMRKIDLFPKLIDPPVCIFSKESHIAAVIDALIAYTIKNSSLDSTVNIHIDLQSNDFAHLEIQAQGLAIIASTFDELLTKSESLQPQSAWIFAGIAIPINQVEQLIQTNNGSTWFESTPSEGTTIHILLPLSPLNM